MTDQNILNIVKDITISRLSNTNLPVNKDGGEQVADFMQVIFEKVKELSKHSID